MPIIGPLGNIILTSGSAQHTTLVAQGATGGVSLVPVSRPTDHGSLAGLDDNDHPQYLLSSLYTGGGGNNINIAALATTYNSGTVYFYGGNNITLSTIGQSISIIGPTPIGGAGNQNISIGGNTDGTPALISSGTFYLMGGNNITLSQNGNSVSIFAASQSVQTQGTFNTTQLADYQLTANNSLSLGTDYTSHTHPQYVNTSASSLFQLTADNSLSLGTDYTSHTHPQYVNTSVSSLFHLTANDSLYQLTADNSLSLGTNYTTHTHSQYLNTSVSSDYQLIANSTLSLGTEYTTHTHSQYLNTSQSSLFQSTGAYLTTADLSQNSSNYFRNWKLTGNTSGTTSSQQGTDFWLAGGNGITLSGSSNTISFSVATNYQSQGAYLTTAALSNHSHNFATTTTNGSLIVVATTNSAGATIAVPSFLTTAQAPGAYLTTAAQSTQTLAFSLGGNSGTTNSSNATAGGYVLAGGSNITLSQSNNSISIHAQSQSVQTQNRFNLTLAGNSTSAGGGYIEISSGTLTLAGGNNITISQNGNALTISGPNVGGAQTGISSIAFSNTTYTSGQISFRDLNGISWQSTTGQAIQITHDLQYTSNTSNITANALNTSVARIQGVIGSNTTYTSGSFSLRDLNGVSFQSTTGQAFQITHDLQYTSNTSNITSNALHTSVSRVINIVAATNSTGGGTASLSSNVSFSNANGMSFYTSAGGAIVGSYTVPATGAFLTTARASNDAIGLNTALTANGVAWTVNSSGLSLNIPAFLTTADLSANSSNYVRNWKLTGNTAGTSSSAQGTDLWLAGGNGVTLSGSSNSISFSVATNYQSQGAYLTTADLSQNSSQYFRNWKLTGNTAGTTSSQQGTDFWLAGGNGITLSGSSNSISFSVGNYLTTARASTDALGLNTAGSNMTWTANSSGLSIDARGYAGTGTSVTNASVTLNSNGLQISVAAGGGVSPVASASNGSFSFTTLAFSNANNVTFGTSAGSIITASVAAPGAAAENNWVSLLGANTDGNVTASGSTIGYSGINLTLSGTNGSVVNISAPATSSLSATGKVSISVNGSTISIGVPNPYISSYENVPNFAQTMTLNGASVSNAVVFNVPEQISASFLRLPVLMTMNSTTIATLASASASASGALYSTWNAVVYSLGVGASSKSLVSVASGSNGWTFSQQISVTNSTQASYTLGFSAQAEGGGTTRTTQYSVSNTNYSFTTNQFTEFSSNRMLDIAFANSLSAGPYWLVLGYSSSSASGGAAGLAALTNCNAKYSNHYGASYSNLSFGVMGSTNMTSGGLLGNGSFSTAGGGTTSAFPISAISSSSSNNKLYFQLLRSA